MTTRIVSWLLIALLMLALLVFWVNRRVEKQAANYLFDHTVEVPAARVGVLLGTSRYLRRGVINLYFKHRMDAAADLYHQGKVKRILVSGDNSTASYNEPAAMQRALVERGVPAKHITLDYAGFRTFDSVVRAHKVFGLQRFIIISQKFHNQRAVYIARSKDIDAWAYNASGVEQSSGWRMQAREYLARVRMMLDLHLLKTEPRFLGKREIIP